MNEQLVADGVMGPVSLSTDDQLDWVYQDPPSIPSEPEPVEPGEPLAVTVLSKTQLDTASAGQDWHGRASIVTRPDGVRVMCFRSGSAHHVNDGALHLMFDDGTWTQPNVTLSGGAVAGFPMNPPLSGGQDAGEPWLFYAPNGDLLLHMWRINYGVSGGGTWQSRSTDGGETWSTPVQNIYAGLTTEQQDLTFTTCDTVNVDGSIYAAGRVWWNAGGSNASAILARSDDDGQTWIRQSTILSGDGSEVGLEYIGDDTFVAMIRDIYHNKSYRFVSTDLGDTWTGGPIASVGIAARQRVYTLAHLRGEPEWWTDPNLVMVGFVHQTMGGSHPRRNCVWLSHDSGVTWSPPYYIDEAAHDAGYGDIFHVSGSEFGVVSYAGPSLDEASLFEYRISIA